MKKNTGTNSLFGIHFVETQYGFEWGGVEVARLTSNKKTGWVALEIKTDKIYLQIYVTKTGKVSITNPEGKEWEELK